jgi:very-short-patch-repair endonuclease
MGRRQQPIDHAIAAAAEEQHGVIAHRQLLRLGLGPSAIQSRLRLGRLHRLHVGVYAVGHRRVSLHGRWSAAVLACGPKALLSHRSAAELWGIVRSSDSRIDVTALGRTRSGHDGVVLHLPRSLDPEDIAAKNGIAVTSLARTLLDLAAVFSFRRLERALEEAERLDLFDLSALDRLIEHSRGRRGVRALRAALDCYRVPVFTRSELERRFLALCRDAMLTTPATNLFLAGFEVDMAWPEHGLVVELDGHRFHGTRAAFERDRVRDAELQVAGYRVLRVTHRRLLTQPHEVAAAVRSLLDCA